jgi:hypothetical protein
LADARFLVSIAPPQSTLAHDVHRHGARVATLRDRLDDPDLHVFKGHMFKGAMPVPGDAA